MSKMEETDKRNLKFPGRFQFLTPLLYYTVHNPLFFSSSENSVNLQAPASKFGFRRVKLNVVVAL